MKNLLFPLCLSLLIAGCGEADKPSPAAPAEAVVAPLDLSRFQLRDIPGSDLQKAVRRDESGKVKEEGTLRNGKRHGMWVVYHADKEMPFTASNYLDDQLSGLHQEFTVSGHIALIAGYINNQLDGPFARYKNGKITEQGFYKNGQFDGTYRRFYENREVLQQEINYKDGKMHGLSKFYNEQGQLVMEYEYEDGEKIRGDVVKPQTASE